MSRTRNTGIIVPDDLFALYPQFFGRELRARSNVFPKIVLDRLLILGRGRHNLCIFDYSPVIDGITMIESPARCFRTCISGGFSGGGRNGWNRGRLITLNDAYRLVERIQHLERTHCDAFERITARFMQSGLARGLLD